MPKKIGNEAKIIALFNALPEDSQRIVADVIKSQTVTPRKATVLKSSVASAKKKSSQSVDPRASTVNFADATESAGAASDRYVPVCVVCDLEESAARHQTDASDYHIFRTELKKRASA